MGRELQILHPESYLVSVPFYTYIHINNFKKNVFLYTRNKNIDTDVEMKKKHGNKTSLEIWGSLLIPTFKKKFIQYHM